MKASEFKSYLFMLFQAGVENLCRDGDLVPVLFFFKEGAVVPVFMPFSSREGKDSAFEAANFVLKRCQPEAAFFISTAWMTEVLPGRDPRLEPPPSDHPGRTEIIVAVGASEGLQSGLIGRVKREGEKIEVLPKECPGGETMCRIFDGVFLPGGQAASA